MISAAGAGTLCYGERDGERMIVTSTSKRQQCVFHLWEERRESDPCTTKSKSPSPTTWQLSAVWKGGGHRLLVWTGFVSKRVHTNLPAPWSGALDMLRHFGILLMKIHAFMNQRNRAICLRARSTGSFEPPLAHVRMSLQLRATVADEMVMLPSRQTASDVSPQELLLDQPRVSSWNFFLELAGSHMLCRQEVLQRSHLLTSPTAPTMIWGDGVRSWRFWLLFGRAGWDMFIWGPLVLFLAELGVLSGISSVHGIVNRLGWSWPFFRRKLLKLASGMGCCGVYREPSIF